MLAPQVCVLILQDLFAIELSSNGADSSFPLFLQIMITNLKIKKKYNCNHTYLKHEELQKIRTIFASKIKLVFSLVIKGHLVIFCYNLVSSLPILLAAFFWVQIKKMNLSFLRIYRPRVIFCAKYSAFGSFDPEEVTRRKEHPKPVLFPFLFWGIFGFSLLVAFVWCGRVVQGVFIRSWIICTLTDMPRPQWKRNAAGKTISSCWKKFFSMQLNGIKFVAALMVT